MEPAVILFAAALFHEIVFKLASAAASAGFTQLALFAVSRISLVFVAATASFLSYLNEREKIRTWFWQRAGLVAEISSLERGSDSIIQHAQQLTKWNRRLKTGYVAARRSNRLLKIAVRKAERAIVAKDKAIESSRNEVAELTVVNNELEDSKEELLQRVEGLEVGVQEHAEESQRQLQVARQVQLQREEAKSRQVQAERETGRARKDVEEYHELACWQEIVSLKSQLADSQRRVATLETELSRADARTEEKVKGLTSQLSIHEATLLRLHSSVLVMEGDTSEQREQRESRKSRRSSGPAPHRISAALRAEDLPDILRFSRASLPRAQSPEEILAESIPDSLLKFCLQSPEEKWGFIRDSRSSVIHRDDDTGSEVMTPADEEAARESAARWACFR